MNQKQTNTKSLSLWTVYLICLGFSTVFFLCFGFNSPIHAFNTDHDYQWFMTMGNGLVHGKIPYRDLFEQKGPIVYFITAFCCLFPNPRIVMLIIEIISMSLFFFFAYRICRKTLNTYFSLILIPILAFTIFTSWCRIFSAATVEEFALPIYAYFLLCWLEFLQEKRHWNWVRALCLGLCLGIVFWVKYTLLYFMIVPMIIWLIISLRRRQYKILLMNAFIMLAGVLIISTPIIIFYTFNHALDDLFHVYFFLNLTAYSSTTPAKLCSSFGRFFIIGPVLLIFILWGITAFTIKHWHEKSGKLLLIAFLINFALLVYSSKNIIYYYGGLIPYAIFGIIDLLELISNKLSSIKHKAKLFIALSLGLITLCIPCSVLTPEWGRDQNEYIPLVVAEVINDYSQSNNKQATLFCYKLYDFGFYNAAKIIPNNYFFANNVFKEEGFPEMYNSFTAYIANQTSDFIITELETWNNENDFLSQYYQPYTGDITTSTYHYNKVHYIWRKHYDLVLLIKK